MFLLILSKIPKQAVELIPDRLKYKQLIELCQLLSSAGITDQMEKVPQAKEIQAWILNNTQWVYDYFKFLRKYVDANINLKPSTKQKLDLIQQDLNLIKACRRKYDLKTAVFRYKRGYSSEYKTNTELPIDLAVAEYRKYIKWKEDLWTQKKIKKT